MRSVLNSSILQIVSDFGKNVSASLDLEETLYAILLNVSHLVPADVLEIKLWDAVAAGSNTVYIGIFWLLACGTCSAFSIWWADEYLNTRQKPLLIPDIHIPDVSLSELPESSPVQSYLGLPLIADDKLIGTLEIGHLSPGVLGQHDQDLIQLVSAQAAYSVRNALLYASEQSRSAELSGLANLAQVFGAVQDYTNLFGRLVETITPLFSVEVLGVLLYDESKRTLEGQIPFQGLPKHIVEIYRTTIVPDSAAEKLLSGREMLVTRNAANSRAWHESRSAKLCAGGQPARIHSSASHIR